MGKIGEEENWVIQFLFSTLLLTTDYVVFVIQ